MAGPTPVSALIHAATMVTAGVYLIARTHGLFLLAPDVLGVGAWSAGVFHLMTHAFFKALLFLAAGAVIHCLHHEHNIFKMGGLRTKLPIVFWSFLIGSAALAALPFTSGFFSKDQILLSAFELHSASTVFGSNIGPILWAGGLLGALLTAIYSFRLVFIVFFGEAHTEPDKQPGWRMAGPLALLCALSIIGGWFSLPLANVFPPSAGHHVSHLIEGISISIPIIGVVLAWLIYYKRSLSVSGFTESSGGHTLRNFWKGGWGIDTLYKTLLVFSRSQTGKMRWYITSMVFGLIVLVSILGWAT